MSVGGILNEKIEHLKRYFVYTPDADRGLDWVAQVLADNFQTADQLEANEWKGDCDDAASWTTQRTYESAYAQGLSPELRLVLGRVLVQRTWIGHAWCEVIEDGRWWSDPTWGIRVGTPSALGFPRNREMLRGFRYNGRLYEPVDYVVS